MATLHKTITTQTLIERTDSSLYAAKRHGRNRVTGETDPEARTGGGDAAKVDGSSVRDARPHRATASWLHIPSSKADVP